MNTITFTGAYWHLYCEYPPLVWHITSDGHVFTRRGEPAWSLDLITGIEQAHLYVRDRQYRTAHRDHGYGDWITITGLEITENEAQRIKAGEDPDEVLLGLQKRYRLIVVPWTPQKTRGKQPGEGKS